MSLSTLEVKAQAALADLKAKAVSVEDKAAAELVVLKSETYSFKQVAIVVVVALVVGFILGHVL